LSCTRDSKQLVTVDIQERPWRGPPRSGNSPSKLARRHQNLGRDNEASSRYTWCVDYPKKRRSWSSIRGVKKTSQASRNLSLPCPYFTACVNVSRQLWSPFRDGGLCCFCREAAKPIRTF